MKLYVNSNHEIELADLEYKGSPVTGATVTAMVCRAKAIAVTAVEQNGGTKITVASHKLTAGDKARIVGSRNYDKAVEIQSVVDGDSVIIDADYHSEPDINAKLYAVVHRGKIDLEPDTDKPGRYAGVMGHDIQTVPGMRYKLFVEAAAEIDGVHCRLLAARELQAEFFNKRHIYTKV